MHLVNDRKALKKIACHELYNYKTTHKMNESFAKCISESYLKYPKASWNELVTLLTIIIETNTVHLATVEGPVMRKKGWD